MKRKGVNVVAWLLAVKDRCDEQRDDCVETWHAGWA
jgi:hypothetical protein